MKIRSAAKIFASLLNLFVVQNYSVALTDFYFNSQPRLATTSTSEQKQILFLSTLFKIESTRKLSFMLSTKFQKKIIKRTEADVSPCASTKLKRNKKNESPLIFHVSYRNVIIKSKSVIDQSTCVQVLNYNNRLVIN